MILKKNMTKNELRYKNALSLIRGIGYDYDGYDTTNSKQMQNLVDEFIHIATLALYPKSAEEPVEEVMVNSLEDNWKANKKFNNEEDICLLKVLANRKLSIHKE